MTQVRRDRTSQKQPHVEMILSGVNRFISGLSFISKHISVYITVVLPKVAISTVNLSKKQPTVPVRKVKKKKPIRRWGGKKEKIVQHQLTPKQTFSSWCSSSVVQHVCLTAARLSTVHLLEIQASQGCYSGSSHVPTPWPTGLHRKAKLGKAKTAAWIAKQRQW